MLERIADSGNQMAGGAKLLRSTVNGFVKIYQSVRVQSCMVEANENGTTNTRTRRTQFAEHGGHGRRIHSAQ